MELTVTVTTVGAELTHPAEVVPVMEYEVVVVGFTTGEPLEYVYVAAPFGANV
jgi:hypothetical protein